MSTKDILTFVLAAIGAVLGIFNAWKLYARDRPKLRVIPVNGIPVGGGGVQRDILFGVQVVNAGQVAVTVNDVGLFHQGTKQRTALLLPFMPDGGTWPRRLEPRSSATFYGKPDEFVTSGHPVRCAYATTACGHTPSRGLARRFATSTSSGAQWFLKRVSAISSPRSRRFLGKDATRLCLAQNPPQ
jgi:hypothetical protein